MSRLSQVFELDKVPEQGLRRHRSPPEYMVDLFEQVAYTDGISKRPGPYEADVIRGFPDRGQSAYLRPTQS